MKKLITILFAFMYLCSCTISTVYYQHNNPPAMPNIEVSERPDVTFSIDWGVCWKGAQTCWMKEDWQPRFAEVIRQRLADSGMFRSVRQTTFSNRSDYHFDFEVNFDNPETMSAIEHFTGSGVASGLLLCIIPMLTQEVRVDFTMRLFASNREAYALAVPAESHTLFSLLQIPLFLITAIAHTSPDKTFDKAMDYFVGTIALQRLYDKKLIFEELNKEKQAQASAQPADNAAVALESSSEKILLAYNPPGLASLDKESYIEKANKMLKQGGDRGYMKVFPAGVLFNTGSSELLSYYKPILDSFVDLYLATDRKSGILLEGYSSNSNNETGKNPKLSEQRIEAVKKYIEDKVQEETSCSSNCSFLHFYTSPQGNAAVGNGMFANDPGCKGGQCYRRVNIWVE